MKRPSEGPALCWDRPRQQTGSELLGGDREITSFCCHVFPVENQPPAGRARSASQSKRGELGLPGAAKLQLHVAQRSAVGLQSGTKVRCFTQRVTRQCTAGPQRSDHGHRAVVAQIPNLAVRRERESEGCVVHAGPLPGVFSPNAHSGWPGDRHDSTDKKKQEPKNIQPKHVQATEGACLHKPQKTQETVPGTPTKTSQTQTKNKKLTENHKHFQRTSQKHITKNEQSTLLTERTIS